MRLRPLVMAAGLLWPVSADTRAAVSYLETGNMLYADCSTSMGRTACISYVMGVTDALSLMGAICTPEHSTARQAIDVVVKSCELTQNSGLCQRRCRSVGLCKRRFPARSKHTEWKEEAPPPPSLPW